MTDSRDSSAGAEDFLGRPVFAGHRVGELVDSGRFGPSVMRCDCFGRVLRARVGRFDVGLLYAVAERGGVDPSPSQFDVCFVLRGPVCPD